MEVEFTTFLQYGSGGLMIGVIWLLAQLKQQQGDANRELLDTKGQIDRTLTEMKIDLSKSVEEVKTDMRELKGNIVFVNVCQEKHRSIDDRMGRIEARMNGGRNG